MSLKANKKFVLLLLGAIVGIFLLALASLARFGHQRPENVILITIDTLRADHLGCYGYPRNTSPEIDKLADRSIVFTNCISQSTTTLPSHASILTSLWPPSHGVIRNGVKLSSDVPSLTSIFEDNGFRTGAIVSSIALLSNYGLNQGFQAYDESMTTSELNREDYLERTAESATDAAVEWILSQNGEKFFLWIHYIDPHGPYYPPEEYRNLFVDDEYYSEGEKLLISTEIFAKNAISKVQALPGNSNSSYYVSQYDAEIRYTDEQIGRLLRFIDESDLASKTLITVTADHGETIMEREWFFCHGTRAYDEQAIIPLIVHFPESEIRKRIDGQIRAIDIMPTILEAVGLENPYTVQGQSLLPLIQSDSKAETEFAFVFSSYGTERHETELGAQKALRTARWKLIRNTWDESRELYDLAEDPLETRNLADSELEMVAELDKYFDQWLEQANTGAVIEQELSEETIKQLEALGYVVR